MQEALVSKKKKKLKKKKHGREIQTFTMFYTKLDFIKIELKKKRNILLNSFKTRTFYSIVLKLEANVYSFRS